MLLSIIIWSLIWFFLIVGFAALILLFGTFLTTNKIASVALLSQTVLICFVITLIASIAAKGVGL